jgi:hypothetical protein
MRMATRVKEADRRSGGRQGTVGVKQGSVAGGAGHRPVVSVREDRARIAVVCLSEPAEQKRIGIRAERLVDLGRKWKWNREGGNRFGRRDHQR